jgi:hypothetical protein
VLSLPPRRGEQPHRSDFGCSCCLRPTVAGSALGDFHFRGHNTYRGRYRVAGQVPGSPSLICLSMPARSLRSRTRRAFARGPAALLDLRSARRPWGIRSGRRNDQSPIEQRNWETLEAQAGMAIAGSNGLPVFSTPKQITSSLRIAATTICLGLRRPACFRRATSAMMAGL